MAAAAKQALRYVALASFALGVLSFLAWLFSDSPRPEQTPDDPASTQNIGKTGLPSASQPATKLPNDSMELASLVPVEAEPAAANAADAGKHSQPPLATARDPHEEPRTIPLPLAPYPDIELPPPGGKSAEHANMDRVKSRALNIS